MNAAMSATATPRIHLRRLCALSSLIFARPFRPAMAPLLRPSAGGATTTTRRGSPLHVHAAAAAAAVSTSASGAKAGGGASSPSYPPAPPLPSISPSDDRTVEGTDDPTVTILQRGPRHVVAHKPPGVLCHHSGWAGSRVRSKKKRGKRNERPEPVPMLQRVRDALHDVDRRGSAEREGRDRPRRARRVNLVHRLDRGASGCLLFAYADETGENSDDVNDSNGDGNGDNDGSKSNDHNSDDGSVGSLESRTRAKGDTARLIAAMKSPRSTKTYVALVRGEGILHGDDLKSRGWFEVDRPIKDEGGEVKEARTLFRFVAGQAESAGEIAGVARPRVSLVLAKPRDGRWHQIRRHLNGLSHPILGDAIHGVSKVNREWREERGMPGERIALHLGRLKLVPTEGFPEGVDVCAPLAEDMLRLLREHAPDVLEAARPALEEEGIPVEPSERYEVGRYVVPDPPPEPIDHGGVAILERGEHYAVVAKPPAVVVHHSSWTRGGRDQTPMLQRVRDEIGRRVNLVHRLDRGASGCLVLSFAQNPTEDGDSEDADKKGCSVTKTLIESMQSSEATKTYLALCDGDGTWNGVNYLQKGWFVVENPVKDEWGKVKEDARTDLRFVASTVLPPVEDQPADHPLEGRKVCVVLARPSTGRWHQIRQHLASGSIGHAILGDASHGGRTRTNRLWKKQRGMIKGRVCLHLARAELPITPYSRGGIDVTCPLSDDLRRMLGGSEEMRKMWEEARPILAEEGLSMGSTEV
ncbi:hypothetical protein ACHAWF_003475 [Thalassiosira exigua]